MSRLHGEDCGVAFGGMVGDPRARRADFAVSATRQIQIAIARGTFDG